MFRLSTWNVDFQKHLNGIIEGISVAGSRTHLDSPSLFGHSSNLLISESYFSGNVTSLCRNTSLAIDTELWTWYKFRSSSLSETVLALVLDISYCCHWNQCDELASLFTLTVSRGGRPDSADRYVTLLWIEMYVFQFSVSRFISCCYSIFMEGAGNVLLRLAFTCRFSQTRCSVPV